jgi:TatD DNase family protein
MLSARRGQLGGVLHCYSGSYEDAVRYVDMGFYIAFGGALTFKNATSSAALRRNYA